MFNVSREAEKLWASIPSLTQKKATGERCLIGQLVRKAINTGLEFGDEPFEISSINNQLRKPYSRFIQFQFKNDFYLNGFLMDVVEVINSLGVLHTPMAREVDLDNQVTDLIMRGYSADDQVVKELRQRQERFYYINDGTRIGPYHDYEPYSGGLPDMYPTFFNAGKQDKTFTLSIPRDLEAIEHFSPEQLLETYTAYALSRQAMVKP